MAGPATRLVLGVAGTAIGGPLGGVVGSAIGGLLFPGELPDVEGPRLDDLRVQSSAYGQPIRRVFGTVRVPGNVIWSTDIQETQHEEEVGGKGAPSQTYRSYTYSVSCAVAVCRGEITGIRRIWAGPKLIYDFRDTVAGPALYQSVKRAASLTIYPGSETQEVDPLISADQGAVNTPAFRGLAYVVFENLQLEEFGNVIPNFTFEVVREGSTTGVRKLHLVEPTEGVTWDEPTVPPFITGINNGVVRVVDQESTLNGQVQLYNLQGEFLGEDSESPLAEINIERTSTQHPSGLLKGGPLSMLIIGMKREAFVTTDGEIGDTREYLPINATGVQDASTRSPDLVDPIRSTAAGEFIEGYAPCADYRHAILFTAPTNNADPDKWYLVQWDGSEVELVDSGTITGGSSTELRGVGNAIPDSSFGATSLMLESDLAHVWVHSSSSDSVSLWEIDDSGVLSRTFNDTNISAGGSEPGSVWADSGIFFLAAGDHIAIYTRQNVLTNGTTTAQAIVEELLGESLKLGTSDYDASALAAITVRGYQLDRPLSIRASLEPLGRVFFFDLVESDYQIQAVVRGGASAVTIPAADLAAHEEGGSSPTPVQVTRTHDLELPRRVTLKYHSPALDLQPNVQYAGRIATNTDQRANFDTTIVLSDDEAAEVTDSILRQKWLEREELEFELSIEYLDLDVGDVVTIVTDRATYVVRITSVRYDLPGKQSYRGVPERSATWTSTNVGGTPTFEAAVVEQIGPTNLKLIDGPLLRATDDDYGFYAAAGGFISGWQGATLHKSSAGIDYTQIATLLNEATIGFATAALGDGPTEVIDTTNTLNVKLVNDKTLSSATEQQVRNGERNNAVLRAGSRWEVIGFIDASLESDGSYTLSNLIRGRKGTEDLTDDHVARDAFILLSGSTIYAIDSTASEDGVERFYKGVTNGNELPMAHPQAFTTNAERLMPLPPEVKLSLNTNAVPLIHPTNENIQFFFVRRSRLPWQWHTSMNAPDDEPAPIDASDFEVDVIDGSGNVVRTIPSGGSTINASGDTFRVIYTRTDQVSDFGSPQTSVRFKIYQLSSRVGRGNPLDITLSG